MNRRIRQRDKIAGGSFRFRYSYPIEMKRNNRWRDGDCANRSLGRLRAALAVGLLLMILSLPALAGAVNFPDPNATAMGDSSIIGKRVKITKDNILVFALALGNASMPRSSELNEQGTSKSSTAGGNSQVIGYLPSPRKLFAQVEMDGKIYVIGGSRGTLETTTDEVVEIDPSDGSIEVVAHLPTRTYGLGAAVIEGAIFAVGGGNVSSVMDDIVRIDPEAGTTEVVAHLPSERIYTATAAVAGKIYVIGGMINEEPWFTDEIVEFNPTTGEVKTVGELPLPIAYEGPAGALVVNEKIYAVPGLTISPTGIPDTWDLEPTDQILEIDPITANTYTYYMPSARHLMGAATAKGKLYVVGGWGAEQIDEVVEIDPSTEQVEIVAHLPTPTVYPGAVALNSRIYSIGGYYGSLGSASFLGTVVEIDPVSSTTTVIATLPSPRSAVSTAAVNGEIYAVGGTNPNFGLLSEVVKIEVLPSCETHETTLSLIGWHMISLPGELCTPCVDGECGDLICALDDNLNPCYIFYYDPGVGGYVMAPPAENIDYHAGMGFWTRTYENNITIDAEVQVPTEAVEVPLQDGWNQIGNPFNFGVAANALKVRYGDTELSLTDAQAQGWVSAYLFGYDTASGGYVMIDPATGCLQPWNGYWMRSYRDDCVLIIPPTECSSSAPVGHALSVKELQARGLELPPSPPTFTPMSEGILDELVVRNVPNPIHSEHTTTFKVEGKGAELIQALRIDIYDLSGHKVSTQDINTKELEWHTDNEAGELLANGVYLYQVWVKIADTWYPTGVHKLAVVR